MNIKNQSTSLRQKESKQGSTVKGRIRKPHKTPQIPLNSKQSGRSGATGTYSKLYDQPKHNIYDTNNMTSVRQLVPTKFHTKK